MLSKMRLLKLKYIEGKHDSTSGSVYREYVLQGLEFLARNKPDVTRLIFNFYFIYLSIDIFLLRYSGLKVTKIILYECMDYTVVLFQSTTKVPV